jgi:glucan biosynthesis protein C
VLLPLMPTIYLLWRWGWASSGPRPMEVLGMETPSLELDKIRLSPGHLWFLYYLMMLFVLFGGLVAAGRRIGLEGFKQAVDVAVRCLVKTRLVAVAMALPTALTLYFMKTPAADTPVYFPPEPRILAYYAVFMGFGWLLHRQTELVEELGRHLWVPLLLAAAVLLPLGRRIERVVQGVPASPVERLATATLGALFGWSLVLLFLGAFVRWASRPRPWVAYLSDAAYWCYLVHLPVVVALQILVAGLAWPGPLKYALLMAVTIAFCLGTYQAFVRYTVIGATLNGPRERPVTP